MADNGAINTGATPTGNCSTCTEPVTGCDVIEETSVACATPYCNDKFATLPKSTKGQLLKRVDTCLYTDPTRSTGSNLVWQRNTSGQDVLLPIGSDMVPAKADAPCFTTVNESTDGTYGNPVIAQTDTTTGGTCLNQVTVDATDEAELAGYELEPICGSDTPKIRPVRIEPLDVDGCPTDIRILAATTITETVGTGLEKIKKAWKWLRSLVLSKDNVPDYVGDEESTTLVPTVWVLNGDCATLARLQLEAGVIGLWAWCSGGLKFYELPKNEDNTYRTGLSLKYIGGTDCWGWGQPGDICQTILTTRPVLWSPTATTLNHSVDLSSYDIPDCATKAIIESYCLAQPSSSYVYTSSQAFGYWDTTASAIAMARGYGVNIGQDMTTTEIPLQENAIKLGFTKQGTGTSSARFTLIGFTN